MIKCKQRTLLYSVLFVGILSGMTVSQVRAEEIQSNHEAVININNNGFENISMISLDFNSPKNLKNEIKKIILDEYIKQHPEKSDIDYDKTEITFDTKIDLNHKASQIKKVSLSFSYKDSDKKSIIPDIQTSINLTIKPGDPVIKLKQKEVNVVKTSSLDLNNMISYSGDYDGMPVLEIIKNGLDTNKVGKYEVEYRLTNLQGKTTSEKLTVNVIEQHTYYYDATDTLLGEAEGDLDETGFADINQYNVVEEKYDGGNKIYKLAKKPRPAINYEPIEGTDYVQQALNAVGKVPYIWGGNDFSGWDCSGMVQRLTGISARTAEQQSHTGTRHYDVWNAPYGALYFYDSGNGAHHVGIALGDGRMVHASSPRVGTIVSNIKYCTPNYWVMPGQ